MTSSWSTSPLKSSPIFNADACTVDVSRRDYFDDVDIQSLLAERIYYLYLLPICTTSTYTVDVKQTVLYDNAKCPTRYYLLITALRDTKELHLADTYRQYGSCRSKCVCLTIELGNYVFFVAITIHDVCIRISTGSA
jgi:hypothetical protein